MAAALRVFTARYVSALGAFFYCSLKIHVNITLTLGEKKVAQIPKSALRHCISATGSTAQ